MQLEVVVDGGALFARVGHKRKTNENVELTPSGSVSMNEGGY